MKLNKTKIFKKYIFNYLADDKFVGQRVASEKYEPYLTKLMLSKIEENDVVLDIGANIGYYTVLFADKVGMNGKVIAVEPDPTNFEILQKNIKNNKLSNVIAVQAALGKENKKMKIYESKDNYGDHRMWKEKTSPSDTINKTITLPVFCKKLDDLLKELGCEKIDFIKMDVQGFEALVINGGKETIKNYKPTIFLEYWPWGIRKTKSNITEMISFLKKYYKKIFWIDEYIQVNFPVSKQFLDKKYNDKNLNDSGNLWVKNTLTLNDRFGQFKDFWIKKFFKRILGRPRT